MDTLLLLGATGLVGRATLTLALQDAAIGRVIAPTRRALPPHPRLINPVIDFDDPQFRLPDVPVDGVICALGTTLRDAGSRATFRRVDFDYPLQFARVAKAHDARAFALVSAMGASSRSPFFYSRTKGELEQALRGIGFESLVFVRPGLLGGRRTRKRPMEQYAQRILGALDRFLPRRWRIVTPEAVAMTLLASVLQAPPGTYVIGSQDIQSVQRSML